MVSDQRSKREQRWRRQLAAWKSSGVSQAEYCRRQGLTQTDFSRWKRELARRDARAAAAVTATPTFVPVRVAGLQPQAYAYELALRGGRVLRFEAGVDAAALGAVVRELERTSC
jgi:hypothetical protein